MTSVMDPWQLSFGGQDAALSKKGPQTHLQPRPIVCPSTLDRVPNESDVRRYWKPMPFSGAQMSMPNCRCWRLTWDTVQRHRRITICTSSNLSVRLPVNDSIAATVISSPRFKPEKEGIDEETIAQSARCRGS